MERSFPPTMFPSFFDFLTSLEAQKENSFDAKLQLNDIRILDKIPCANGASCEKPGLQVCSSCKLVSYCSKTCQLKHWVLHKIDCKSKMMDSKWLPGYIQNFRQPSFLTSSENSLDDRRQEYFGEKHQRRFGMSMSIWGNIPAFDVICLSRNEGSQKSVSGQDFSIAFVASGDIRQLVRTVNELPKDYTGTLTILLNDGQPYVTVRNLVLLIILMTLEDSKVATEIALHIWFSAFLPSSYLHTLQSIFYPILPTIMQPFFTLWLGKRGNVKLCGALSSQSQMLLAVLTKFPKFSFKAARAEIQRVFSHPERVDLWDRFYSNTEPAHRVAFEQFRGFPVVLPFGAPRGHIDTPNPFLFSVKGEWLQNDGANPLESWDTLEAIQTGKK
ncbi:MYND-type zinc finger protein samB [Abortiporus biennis]